MVFGPPCSPIIVHFESYGPKRDRYFRDATLLGEVHRNSRIILLGKGSKTVTPRDDELERRFFESKWVFSGDNCMCFMSVFCLEIELFYSYYSSVVLIYVCLM